MTITEYLESIKDRLLFDPVIDEFHMLITGQMGSVLNPLIKLLGHSPWSYNNVVQCKGQEPYHVSLHF